MTLNKSAENIVDEGAQHPNCPLCATPGGDWVWNDHVREFSDLSREDRVLCMDAVVLLEQFVLRVFKADKANIATLGNVVPHLHWHVIPRFTDDKHFPAPVWAMAKSGVSLSPRQQLVLDSKPKWMLDLRAELLAAFPG
jgi:diadenosine tetraphosphate (Ap4A) HIT family hydrolase